MTLPPYTQRREDEAPQLGRGSTPWREAMASSYTVQHTYVNNALLVSAFC